MPETIPAAIAAALLAAQLAMPSPEIDSHGRIVTTKGAYEFRYASLKSVRTAALPALHANGFVVTQELSTDAEHGYVYAHTRLTHESGYVVVFSPFGVPMQDPRAQAAGGAATYAMRYSLAANFSLTAGDDLDGNDTDGNYAQITQRPGAPAPAPRPAPPSRPPAPRTSPAAGIVAAVDGFDRAANKRAIFSALTERGFDTTALKAAVLRAAEAMEGAKLDQWPQQRCMDFLQAINDGKIDTILEEDTGGIPV